MMGGMSWPCVGELRGGKVEDEANKIQLPGDFCLSLRRLLAFLLSPQAPGLDQAGCRS